MKLLFIRKLSIFLILTRFYDCIWVYFNHWKSCRNKWNLKLNPDINTQYPSDIRMLEGLFRCNFHPNHLSFENHSQYTESQSRSTDPGPGWDQRSDLVLLSLMRKTTDRWPPLRPKDQTYHLPLPQRPNLWLRRPVLTLVRVTTILPFD